MNDSQAITAVSASPERLTIRWADGSTSEVSSLWLRDNRPDDRDPHSGQRLVDISDVPESPRLRSAVLAPEGVYVEWAGEECRTLFNREWLAAHARGSGKPAELSVRTWLEGGMLDAARDFAWASPAELRADPRLRLRWLTRLLQDGLAFLDEVAVEEPALLAAVPLVGRVLETNYGLTFDVRSVAQPENLAYTDLGLGLHTDNPYREPVPGFQALHALLPSREGGESLFADGFALAARLREMAPEDFALLTTTPVPFLYRSRDAELYAERPLIQLSAGGEIVSVHYNSRSVAPLPPGANLATFYAAYRRFATLLREARFQLRMRLGAGTLVVFDNQRILHGRTAFASARFPRHLRGCYLTRDSVHSEARLLRRQLAAAEGA
jgi:alpha-ketoglutarate-dependent taurine dioxygenase